MVSKVSRKPHSGNPYKSVITCPLANTHWRRLGRSSKSVYRFVVSYSGQDPSMYFFYDITLRRISMLHQPTLSRSQLTCSGCGKRHKNSDYWFYCSNCFDHVSYDSYRSRRLASRSTLVKMLLGVWISYKKIHYWRLWCVDCAKALRSKRTFKVFVNRYCDRCEQKIDRENSG